MRTDIDDIYKCNIFNKDNMHKVFLLGFMYTPTNKCTISDIYLKCHGNYYVIKATMETILQRKLTTNMSIYDDFSYAKLHTHVIETEKNNKNVRFTPLIYYKAKSPIEIEYKEVKCTNDVKELSTAMFQMCEGSGYHARFVVNLDCMEQCSRDDFIKSNFPGLEGENILDFWKSNDEFQQKTYLRLKAEGGSNSNE